jgi:dihydroflavonol-4-reductase
MSTSTATRMKVCVTGATGYLGGHIVRCLCERGHEVQVACRDLRMAGAIRGLDARRMQADLQDYSALRRAFTGVNVVFHTAGYVGSRPVDWAWRVNAEAPAAVVEAAAAAGCRRVVLTSSISAIGLPADSRPADESTPYPDDWLGLTYPDSKHEGERVALEAAARRGIELVIVNPGYVLGAPIDRSRRSQTSTRIVGNYLRGRLPAVIAAPMNFVDVQDVAVGHLLAAQKGRAGERYILGGCNTTWPVLIDRVAALSGVHHPVVVLPRETARVARLGDTLGLPGLLAVEAYELMAQDWRFCSDKARRELGYRTRPLDHTLLATIDWYEDLIERGAFDKAHRSPLSTLAAGTRALGRLGLLKPVKVGQRLARRRVIAGV